MQVRINGNSVAVEYESNLEITRHIGMLNQLLEAKLREPRRMIIQQLQFVDSHGNTSGELTHRTEF